MNTEDIKEKLDEIDILMISSLDKNHSFSDENVVLHISNIIDKIQDELIKSPGKFDLNIEKRFRILATAFISANDKETKISDEANKYFRWMDNAKINAEKEKLSFKEALNTARYEDESGHERSEKVTKTLAESYILGSNKGNLPKKQNWFDKIRGKIKDFFNKNATQTSETIDKVSQVNSIAKGHDELVKRLRTEHKDETVVISDLHGNLQKWEMVKKTLIENPKRKLIIEGDAMDRGQFGVEILLQIKELSDKGMVEYLPGNHDIFAYNYLATKGSQFESTDTHIYAKETWVANGGDITLAKFEDENYNDIMENEIKNGRISHRISKDELIEWLGNCPIQKKIQQSGISYALSHAMFDEELYEKDPNFNLRKALELELDGKEENIETLNKFNTCMWYRENDNDTHYSPISWPNGNIVVVGHTRQKKANVQYLEKDPNKPIIYLDCGNGMLQGFNISAGHHEPIEEKFINSQEAAVKRDTNLQR